MGGVVNSSATFPAFGNGKAGALVAGLNNTDAVDENALQQRVQRLHELLKTDPVEYGNLQRLLWTPGPQKQDRAQAFYQKIFHGCTTAQSLETKLALLALVLWLAEHPDGNEEDHRVILDNGLTSTLVNVLQYNATFYLEEMLSVVTRLCILFAQYVDFAEEFVDKRGESLICDILNNENNSDKIIQNVTITLYLLSEWKPLRLTAHATQVPAIGRVLLSSSNFSTTVGAHLVVNMCNHPDLVEAETNVRQLTLGAPDRPAPCLPNKTSFRLYVSVRVLGRNLSTLFDR